MSGQVQEIEIQAIRMGKRLRVVDVGWVEKLAESILENGLQQPLQVRLEGDGSFALIAGAHRLEACRRLGLVSVSCQVVECDDLRARLMEIDENLYRHELTPLDRAAFLAERKKVYEALYPETKHGVAATNARLERQNENFSFCESTAKSTGLNRRTVETSIRLHNKLDPQVREMLKGTWAAKNQSDLTALSKLEPKEQRKVVAELKLDEAGKRETPIKQVIGRMQRNADPAIRIAKVEAELKALEFAWSRARPYVQQQFLDGLVKQGIVVRPKRSV